MKNPTQARLHEIFDYSEGELYRKVSRKDGTIQHVLVGCESDHAILVMIDNVLHSVHKLVWIRHNGAMPRDMRLHHINGNRFDNRIENLRLATQADSIRSAGFRKSNTSGYKGVATYARNGKWRACIKVNWVQKHLGIFDTKEEAYAAYCAAAEKYHGEFANFGTPRQYVRPPRKDAPPSSGQMTEGAGATGMDTMAQGAIDANHNVALTDQAPAVQVPEHSAHRAAKRQTEVVETVTGTRFCKRCAGHRKSDGGTYLSDAINRRYWVCQSCTDSYRAVRGDSGSADAGRAQP